MKRWFGRLALLSSFVVAGQVAQAGQVGLADWCVNVNGDTSTACNGGGTGGTTGTAPLRHSMYGPIAVDGRARACWVCRIVSEGCFSG